MPAHARDHMDAKHLSFLKDRQEVKQGPGIAISGAPKRPSFQFCATLSEDDGPLTALQLRNNALLQNVWAQSWLGAGCHPVTAFSHQHN